MVNMARGNVYAGLVCTAIAVYYLYESMKLPFWSEVGPGAGTLPVLSGVCFGILALMLVFQNLRSASVEGQVDFTRWKASAIIMGALVAATLTTKLLGMILIIFLYMIIHTMVVEGKRWKIAVPTAVTTAVVFYFLFERLLDVPLVIGVFGI